MKDIPVLIRNFIIRPISDQFIQIVISKFPFVLADQMKLNPHKRMCDIKDQLEFDDLSHGLSVKNIEILLFILEIGYLWHKQNFI
jgi:hypothetical protein